MFSKETVLTIVQKKFGMKNFLSDARYDKN